MKQESVLSISILISNRPDTVEKCLRSLSSLRENVSCELILTDTGCGEEVRRIIEAYADVLLDFEWCNDFSKARNLGLEHAKGEWFLYMDDDEWFEDTKEIEEFFLSGAYRGYTKGYYSVRNYRNRQATQYDDGITPRMAKLGREVRFYNAIHEGLYTLPGKSKVLGSYAHHYGYVFETEADKYKHAQRNLTPLLKEYKNNPDNLHYVIQIAQEYNSISEYRKSIEISLEGIEAYSPKKTTVLYLNALCINVVERHVRLFLYEDAVAYAEKYLADERMVNMGKARILAPMIIALYRLERYDACAERVEEYMQIYNDYLIHKEVYQEQSAYMMYGCFTNNEKNDVMSIGVAVNLLCGAYDRAEDVFNKIISDESIVMPEELLWKHAIEAYLKEGALSAVHPCVTILNKLLEWEIIHPKLIGYFEEQRKNNAEVFVKQSDKWQYLNGNCWYLNYLKLGTEQKDAEDVPEEYQRLWSDVENVLPKSVELGLWEKAETACVDMETIIEAIPYYKWRKAVTTALAVMPSEQRERLHEYIVSKCDADSNKILYWKSGYYLKELAETKELPEKEIYQENDEERQAYGENVREVFACFAESSVCLAKRLYHEEVLLYSRDMLPEYMQAAFLAADLPEYIENADYICTIRKLKAIKEILPSIAIAVKLYTKWIEAQIKRQEKEQEESQHALSAEMQQLAQAVKAKIQFFLQEGNREVAVQLIAQLEAITGMNPELDELKKQTE